MRRVSKKRQKLIRQFKEERRQYWQSFWTCPVCKQRPTACTHEMAKGIHREKAFQDRRTWLATCIDCNNNEMNDYSEYPLERQLALKWCQDRSYFDLEGFNVLRDRAPGAITMAEVIPWICRELDN